MDDDFKEAKSLEKSGWVMFDKTPFYAQSGGQRGDSGELEGFGKVTDTQKIFELNLSHVALKKPLHVGDCLHVRVDSSRAEIQKHHSATHLLHGALRSILGDHIAQAGSSVDANRLRFDFSHPKGLSSQEIIQVEDFVNHVVLSGVDATTEIMDVESAKRVGRWLCLAKNTVMLCVLSLLGMRVLNFAAVLM